MRPLADLFKALSDETRLQILALLLVAGESCVCDVEALLGITQSKASRHLRTLRAAGLVVDRRDGAWVHYSIPPQLDADRARVLEAVRGLLTPERTEDLEARLRHRASCAPDVDLCPTG